MEYLISDVAKMFNLTISTIRYYDKIGLFENIKRESNIRKFQEKDIETLRVIECLKKSGLEIKDIKNYMDLCKIGPSTYKERQNLFIKQKNEVLKEIEHLNQTLAMLEYKIWYYEYALKEGKELKINEINLNLLPIEIKNKYILSHKNR